MLANTNFFYISKFQTLILTKSTDELYLSCLVEMDSFNERRKVLFLSQMVQNSVSYRF